MAVTYLGSRQHIAEVLANLESTKTLVVVDAVTLNREELEAQLDTAMSAEARLLIRPELATEDVSERAAEYLSWLDSVESILREHGDTQVLHLPRAVDDWEDDINQAIEFNTFCLVEPAKRMSLISRDRRSELVHAAVEAASSGREVRSCDGPSTVPAESIVNALNAESEQEISFEQAKPADLFDVMVTAGITPDLCNRVVAAQQLVVAESASDGSTGAEAIDDFRIYVSTKRE